MNKNLKLALSLGLVAMTSCAVIGCSVDTQDKENVKPSISTDSNSEKISYVKVDLADDESSRIYYERDGVVFELFHTLAGVDVYSSKDYYITMNYEGSREDESGYAKYIYSLILVNKYTAEVEDYGIYDEENEREVEELYICDFNEETGKITLTTPDLGEKEGYIFDMETKKFSDKIKLK